MDNINGVSSPFLYLLDLMKQWGVPSALVLIIILLIQYPDAAEKIKSLVWKYVFAIFRFGSKQYLSSTVNHCVSSFVNNHVARLIPSAINIKLRIKWVNSKSDAVFEEDGTVILRLHETPDQARNILAATQLVIPHIVFPKLRSNVNKTHVETIDLVLLRKLSNIIGDHAYGAFQKYFLQPELQNDSLHQELFSNLVELDNYGIFIPVFLEELNSLGIKLADTGNLTDKTKSIDELLDFLLVIARRNIGEEVVLDHHSADFRIGVILMAKKWKAESEGVQPYINRIKIDLAKGAESIYLIAFPSAIEHLKRVINVVDEDTRLVLAKNIKIPIEGGYFSRQQHINIVLLKRNKLVTDHLFSNQVSEQKIVEGGVYTGNVLDVSKNCCSVDIMGINGIITVDEISWRYVNDCGQVLRPESTVDFLVRKIDADKNELVLSLKLPDSDPWAHCDIPSVNDEIDVKIESFDSCNFIASFNDAVDIFIPFGEATWNQGDIENRQNFIGKTYKVIITEKNDENRMLIASIKRLIDDPWPTIYKEFPKGHLVRATVDCVYPQYVIVNINDEVKGYVSRDAMIQAGHEYADYQNTLVKGQGLDLVVTKVSPQKQRVSLNFERNINK